MTWEDQSRGVAAAAPGPNVAVILVCHNGQRWLPTVVDALPAALLPTSDSEHESAGSMPAIEDESDNDFALWQATDVSSVGPVTPASVIRIAVDTGSTDESRSIAEEAGFTVIDAPAATPFGRAVAIGVAHIAEAHPDIECEWLWLLHDDSAPVAGSLPSMLAVAAADGADVVGAKVHNWSGAPIILERGVRLSRAGRLYYGVDLGERDQGQYDHIGGEPVYAVTSAGMLVSMRSWTALNGFDPALASSGEDIDYCRRARRSGFTVMLCTDAAVRHVRAMSRRRRKEPLTSRMGADARYAVMHILIAHAPRAWVWWYLLRLTTGSLVRAGLQLLQRDVRGARDQVEALTRLYTHPSRVRLSRARVAAAGPPSRTERELMLPWRNRWRMAWHALGAVVERVTAVPTAKESPIFLPEQEGTDPAAVISRRRQIWQRVLHRPLTLVVALTSLIALVRGGGLLFASAPLTGPRLADTSASSWSLLSSYAAGWHDIGRGVDTAAPGWMLILGIMAIPFVGHVSGVLAFIITFFVPVMTLITALVLRTFVRSAWVSTTVALLIALSPVFTTAAGDGDIATLIVALVLPLVLRLAARAYKSGEWSPAIAVSLGATALLAFSPLAWAQLIVILAAVLLWRRAAGGLWLKWLAVVGVSIALLMPWPLAFIRRPWAALLDAGPTDVGVASQPWAFASHSAHQFQWWMVGLSVAALLAMVRPHSRHAVVGVWAVAFLPLSAFLVGSRTTLIVSGVPETVNPSVQSAVVLWALASAACIALACDGLLAQVRSSDVSAVHLSAAVASVAVAAFAFGAVAAYVPTTESHVVRGRQVTVPEFVAIDLMRPLRPRALVLRADDPNPVEFYVAARAAQSLGDADMLRVTNPDEPLAGAVATLVSVGEPYAGARIRAAQLLADAAIKYIVLPDEGAGAEDIATAVAATPGLKAMTTAGEQQPNWVWRVTQFAGRASYAKPDVLDRAAVRAFVVGSGPGYLDLRGTAKRPAMRRGDIRIADATIGWNAEIDGKPATIGRSTSGAVAVDLPSTAQTRVHIWRDDSTRRWWIAGQVLLWLIVLVMALPSRQRTQAVDEDGDA